MRRATRTSRAVPNRGPLREHSASEITRKGDPGLLTFPTAYLDQLVCRVYKLESLRSALRTGICQGQVEVWGFVFDARTAGCALPPRSLACEP
jgi:hypothetical protein